MLKIERAWAHMVNFEDPSFVDEFLMSIGETHPNLDEEQLLSILMLAASRLSCLIGESVVEYKTRSAFINSRMRRVMKQDGSFGKFFSEEVILGFTDHIGKN